MANPTPPANSPKKKPQIKFSMFWMYAVIIFFLVGMLYFDDHSVSKEVSYSELENIITDSLNVRDHGITKIIVHKKEEEAQVLLSDSLARKQFDPNQLKDDSKVSLYAKSPRATRSTASSTYGKPTAPTPVRWNMTQAPTGRPISGRSARLSC